MNLPFLLDLISMLGFYFSDRGHAVDPPNENPVLSNFRLSGDTPPSPKPPQSASAIAEIYHRYLNHAHVNTTPPISDREPSTQNRNVVLSIANN